VTTPTRAVTGVLPRTQATGSPAPERLRPPRTRRPRLWRSRQRPQKKVGDGANDYKRSRDMEGAGESAGRRRVRRLEFVVQGVRERATGTPRQRLLRETTVRCSGPLVMLTSSTQARHDVDPPSRLGQGGDVLPPWAPPGMCSRTGADPEQRAAESGGTPATPPGPHRRGGPWPGTAPAARDPAAGKPLPGVLTSIRQPRRPRLATTSYLRPGPPWRTTLVQASYRE